MEPKRHSEEDVTALLSKGLGIYPNLYGKHYGDMDKFLGWSFQPFFSPDP